MSNKDFFNESNEFFENFFNMTNNILKKQNNKKPYKNFFPNLDDEKNKQFIDSLDFYRHEALHTTNILSENINNHLAEHWYYQSGINIEFNNKIDIALKMLLEAYQLCDEEKENL